MLGVPLENGGELIQRCVDQNPCEVVHRGCGGCGDLYFSNFNRTRHAVEPRTGIAFPTILDNFLSGERNSSWLTEVSRTFSGANNFHYPS